MVRRLKALAPSHHFIHVVSFYRIDQKSREAITRQIRCLKAFSGGQFLESLVRKGLFQFEEHRRLTFSELVRLPDLEEN
ncbi:hypothetical protein ACLOJK_001907 [Asimina triloba]